MVKYLTIGSHLTIRACPCASPVARAVWISQRLRWRRHSAEGSRACLQAWEGACRRTRALFHVLRGAASPAKTRNRTHENHGVGSANFSGFYIWNPPTLADSRHKKCSCRFRWSKIGASVFQIILYLQEFGFSFVFLDGMYHFARASLFLSRALPAFFFFIDYLFFFIIIYYTTCHRTAGQI